MCIYKYRDGNYCTNDPELNSIYCIFHTPLPKEKYCPEWQCLSDIKERELIRKVESGYYNFEGAKFGNLNVSLDFKAFGIFIDAIFYGQVEMEGEFSKGVSFLKAIFEEDTRFPETFFGIFRNKDSANIYVGETYFDQALFKSNVRFDRCFISYISFNRTRFLQKATFSSTFNEDADFSNSHFYRDADFSNSRINEDLILDNVIIHRDLLLLKANIKKINVIEKINRQAKIHYENIGNPDESDKYYFNEMVARRKQKRKLHRYSEKIIETFFYYGIKPYLTFLWYIAFMCFFSIIFFLIYAFTENEVSLSVLINCTSFSISNSIIPGQGPVNEITGVGKIVAGLEAIIGVFFLGSFIAIYSRKFLRS
ncbi:pentapeptide repeat-containing protein [uncultured Methanospirillum sp.]|uniref:pentapeptide repeat-containing protein n=1 Tax=uncultured Methanospirillum sp. TaxID=262503 RepID=UPI0029C67440|nr:pentapeptide repeat-containing protein [uncultured Methanospirillum sp.]